MRSPTFTLDSIRKPRPFCELEFVQDPHTFTIRLINRMVGNVGLLHDFLANMEDLKVAQLRTFQKSPPVERQPVTLDQTIEKLAKYPEITGLCHHLRHWLGQGRITSVVPVLLNSVSITCRKNIPFRDVSWTPAHQAEEEAEAQAAKEAEAQAA